MSASESGSSKEPEGGRIQRPIDPILIDIAFHDTTINETAVLAAHPDLMPPPQQ